MYVYVFCDKAVIGGVYSIERYLGKIVRYIIFRKPESLRNSECYENNLYKNNLLLFVLDLSLIYYIRAKNKIFSKTKETVRCSPINKFKMSLENISTYIFRLKKLASLK